MTRLLIIDPQFAGEPDIEREVTGAGFEYDIIRPEDGAISADALKAADAIVNCRSRHALPSKLVDGMDRAKIVVQAGVGYNHIDIDACAKRGIPVCNTPDYGTVEVADHTIAMTLDLLRATTAYNNRLLVRDDAWSTLQLPVRPVRRIRGMTFGIIGLGRIGRATALRARAFEMNVAFYDPYVEAGTELSFGFHRCKTLNELLATSDIVSLHCPLTSETSNIIDHAAIERMKPDAILVNTSRGGTVDLDAVYDGLRNDSICAAGLDVLSTEPLDRSHPLLDAWTKGESWLEGRLLVTPHAAFYTPQSLRDMRRLSTLAVVEYLRDGSLRSCINLPQLHRHGFEFDRNGRQIAINVN